NHLIVEIAHPVAAAQHCLTAAQEFADEAVRPFRRISEADDGSEVVLIGLGIAIVAASVAADEIVRAVRIEYRLQRGFGADDGFERQAIFEFERGKQLVPQPKIQSQRRPYAPLILRKE